MAAMQQQPGVSAQPTFMRIHRLFLIELDPTFSYDRNFICACTIFSKLYKLESWFGGNVGTSCVKITQPRPPPNPCHIHIPPPHHDHLRAKCIIMRAKFKYVEYYCKNHMEPSERSIIPTLERPARLPPLVLLRIYSSLFPIL